MAADTLRSAPCFCGSDAGSAPLETHSDRVSGAAYRMRACPGCGVVYSEPRHEVGADWYRQAVPCEEPVPAEQDWRFRAFLRHHPAGARLLDMGCGAGAFLRLARSHGYPQALGLDQDERMAAQARQEGLEVFCEDWRSFCRSRRDGEFDLVTLFDVLEHLPEPRQLLSEVRRLLRRGGGLVVTLPNELRPLPFGREVWDYPPHHFTRWTPAALARFLEAGGFRVERHEVSPLEIRPVLDSAVDACLLKPLLTLAKRVLFGPSADLRAPVSELSRRSPGGEGRLGPSMRKALFHAVRNSGRALFFVPVALWVLHQRRTHPERGTCQFVLARKEDA